MPPTADAQRETSRGVSLRAVLIGVTSIALLSLVNPYLQFLIQSWWIVGVGSVLTGPVSVSYTHLTLPTKRIV